MTDHPDDGGIQPEAPPRILELDALRYAVTALERFEGTKERIKDYVRREPVKALGIALGAGVIIGWLTRRR